MSTSRDRERWLVPIFAVTVFTSAFLLFQVQPLISRFIFPWFGGSPAVWTAAMLFFQAVLFGGYLYAHLTTSRLSAARQWQVHLGLLGLAVAAVLATGIVPPAWPRPTGTEGESPLARIFVLLAVTVGLPYFAISSSGPLLQRWFSQDAATCCEHRLKSAAREGRKRHSWSPFAVHLESPPWHPVAERIAEPRRCVARRAPAMLGQPPHWGMLLTVRTW
jgi:hypothetical protein